MRKRDLAFIDALRESIRLTGGLTDAAKIMAARRAYGGMTSDEALLRKAESKLANNEIAALVNH